MDFLSFLGSVGGSGYAGAISLYPFSEDMELFFSDFDRFTALGEEKEDPHLFYLSAYLRLAYRQHDKYVSRGIPDDIFLATFQDIILWADEYREKNGRAGLDRINWLRRHIELRLFRLGELQFEIPRLPLPDIWDGIDLPSAVPRFVHIPEGTDLSKAEDSFRAALDFFHEDSILFLIHSWLLSPEVTGLLPQGSRIRSFSSLFTLCGTEDDRQAEERIFGSVSDDVSSYPQRTSLAKAARAWLMEGGKLLSGYGYLVRSRNT